jgi:hypothetical protein
MWGAQEKQFKKRLPSGLHREAWPDDQPEDAFPDSLELDRRATTPFRPPADAPSARRASSALAAGTHGGQCGGGAGQQPP